MKLKCNKYITCPRCIANNKDKEDLECVPYGYLKVNEINKLYTFECSVCGLKLEYIINAMPRITILN